MWGMYIVLRAPAFDKEALKNLSLEQQRKIERFERKQLTINPYVGDPCGRPFFREKRLGNKRVYFLINDQFHAVLLIGISDKKTQQITIDDIQEAFDTYTAYIKEELRRRGAFSPWPPPSDSQQSY